MEVIQLPPILPGTLNLAAVNLRLLSNEIKLDWSNVQAASKEHLRILLAGLDLIDASDILGLETVPDALAMEISNVLLEWRVQSFRFEGDVGTREDPRPDSHTPVAWIVRKRPSHLEYASRLDTRGGRRRPRGCPPDTGGGRRRPRGCPPDTGGGRRRPQGSPLHPTSTPASTMNGPGEPSPSS